MCFPLSPACDGRRRSRAPNRRPDRGAGHGSRASAGPNACVAGTGRRHRTHRGGDELQFRVHIPRALVRDAVIRSGGLGLLRIASPRRVGESRPAGPVGHYAAPGRPVALRRRRDPGGHDPHRRLRDLGGARTGRGAVGRAEVGDRARGWAVGRMDRESAVGAGAPYPRARLVAPEWQVTVEPTKFPLDSLGAWFTDVTAGVTIDRGPVVLSLSSAARWSTFYGSTGAASAFLQWFVAPAVSVEVGAGSYLREPYQGFPRAGFFVLGVRIHGAPRPVRRVLTNHWAPLVPEARGDSLVVQFRFPSVRAVAIAGDWNSWQTRPLRFVGGDLWEGTLALARGVYHFNLLVDGRDWVVPNGVATIPDGLGGMVGVLLVR